MSAIKVSERISGFDINVFPNSGIPKVFLPFDEKELNAQVLLDNIDGIYNAFLMNQSKIKYFKDWFNGKQAIQYKTRPYVDQQSINHKILENHAFSQVTFKTSSLFGEPVQYAKKEALVTDDIGIFNDYLNDISKEMKDNQMATDVYSTGVGYQLIVPKKSGTFDIAYESPFDVHYVNNMDATMVYSNKIGEPELFGVIFTRPLENDLTVLATIYTSTTMYEIEFHGVTPVLKSESKHHLNSLPLIEYTRNSSRMGLIELNYSLLHAINVLSSTSMDNLVDVANEMIIIVNATIDGETLGLAKMNGALCIGNENPSLPVDVKTFQKVFNHGDVQVLYERLINACYDIAGVPQGSGNVTSGGDTGQARLLGNGWEKHYTDVKTDQSFFRYGLRKALKVMLAICRNTQGCEIGEINHTNLDIKFNVNMSDNLLVKTQSLQTLLNLGFGTETSLDMVSITSDTFAVANERDANIEKQKEEQMQMEQQKQNNQVQDIKKAQQ